MNKIAVLRFAVACIGGWAFGYALSGTIHNGLGELTHAEMGMLGAWIGAGLFALINPNDVFRG